MTAGMHGEMSYQLARNAMRVPYVRQPATGMTPLSQLTRRNFLIAVHDALATAFAVGELLSAFRGRRRFFDRLPMLLRILPYFIAFSVIVCYIFNLTTTKWRFISLPDALNILRVATVLTVGLVVLDYVFVFSRRRQVAGPLRPRSPSFSTGSSRCFC